MLREEQKDEEILGGDVGCGEDCMKMTWMDDLRTIWKNEQQPMDEDDEEEDSGFEDYE